MIELGVNIDHVATIRQARRTYEPDPVWAAVEAHLGGADGITVHLREDRRHIQDEDVRRLRELTHIKLNLEMAATDEMVGIALATQPHAACLVPEKREERTTEGGLDIIAGRAHLAPRIATLAEAGIRVEVFDPNCCEGPPAKAFEHVLAKCDWDVVGISTTGMTLRYDLELAHIARRCRPLALLPQFGRQSKPIWIL